MKDLKLLQLFLPELPGREQAGWMDAWFRQQCGMYLVRKAAELEYELLDNCAISSDGCSYRLQIHKERYFADGSEIAASDVVTALKEYGLKQAAIGEQVRELKVHSRSRLEILLKKPVPDFLDRLAPIDLSRRKPGGVWAPSIDDDGRFFLKINPHHPGAAASHYQTVLLQSQKHPHDALPFASFFPGTWQRLPQTRPDETLKPLDGGLALFLILKNENSQGKLKSRLRTLFHRFAKQRSAWLCSPLLELFPKQGLSFDLGLPDLKDDATPSKLNIHRPRALFDSRWEAELIAFAAHHGFDLSFTDDRKVSDAFCFVFEDNRRMDQEWLLHRAMDELLPLLSKDLATQVPKIQRISHEPQRLRQIKEFFQSWLHRPSVVPILHIPLVLHSNCIIGRNQVGLPDLLAFQERPHQQRAEEWRQRNLSALGSSVQMLAHDLKKPFSMLEGMLKLIENTDSAERIKELARDFLPEVRHMTRSAQDMIADILEISADKSLPPEAISFQTVLDAMRPLLLKPKRTQQLIFQLEHEYMILADALKIARVLANILNNAVQASPDQGVIRLSTKNSDDHSIEVRVHNEGSYIAPEQREQIFSPFVSAKGAEGTGLGLAIAQKIILAHRGRIWCESHRDSGTTFCFTLPCSYQSDHRPPDLQERWESWHQSTLDRGGSHLIVIEDDAIFREIWESADARVQTFADPLLFLEAVERKPDLLAGALALVTDGHFEDCPMEGVELLQMLRGKGLHCPLYLCSHGYGSSEFPLIEKDHDSILGFVQQILT